MKQYKQYLKLLEKNIKEEFYRNFGFYSQQGLRNPNKIDYEFVIEELKVLSNPSNRFRSNLLIYTLYYDYSIICEEKDYSFSSVIMNYVVTSIDATSEKVSEYIHKYYQERELREVIDIFKQYNYNTYLVGGCVRDILLNKTPKDFDFVTDMSYDELISVFMSNGYNIKENGKQFLVLMIEKNGYQFEISNFRNEGNYKDGRRPELVEIGDIWTDSERRDFTINAIYYNIITNKIIDPTAKGLEDISNNFLRFIGKPEDRIRDDYLRIFRFYRFIKSKGLTPDKKSLSACRNMFEDGIKKTSSERIRVELERIVGINNA